MVYGYVDLSDARPSLDKVIDILTVIVAGNIGSSEDALIKPYQGAVTITLFDLGKVGKFSPYASQRLVFLTSLCSCAYVPFVHTRNVLISALIVVAGNHQSEKYPKESGSHATGTWKTYTSVCGVQHARSSAIRFQWGGGAEAHNWDTRGGD